MKRRWNRIPKTEMVVCFGHIRICVVDPQRNEKNVPRRDAGSLRAGKLALFPAGYSGMSTQTQRSALWPCP